MLPSAVYNYLAWLVFDFVVSVEFICNGLAKFGDAATWSILRESICQSLGGCILNVLRGIEVRFPGAKANDVFSRCSELFCLAEIAKVSDGASDAALLEIE